MKKFTVIDALGQLQLFNGDVQKDKDGKEIFTTFRLEPRKSIVIEAESKDKLPNEVQLAESKGFVYVQEYDEPASKKTVKKEAN